MQSLESRQYSNSENKQQTNFQIASLYNSSPINESYCLTKSLGVIPLKSQKEYNQMFGCIPSSSYNEFAIVKQAEINYAGQKTTVSAKLLFKSMPANLSDVLPIINDSRILKIIMDSEQKIQILYDVLQMKNQQILMQLILIDTSYPQITYSYVIDHGKKVLNSISYNLAMIDLMGIPVEVFLNALITLRVFPDPIVVENEQDFFLLKNQKLFAGEIFSYPVRLKTYEGKIFETQADFLQTIDGEKDNYILKELIYFPKIDGKERLDRTKSLKENGLLFQENTILPKNQSQLQSYQNLISKYDCLDNEQNDNIITEPVICTFRNAI